MSFKSYLFPQMLLLTGSPYNRLIRVNEEWGKMKLIVNGSPQSGSYIRNLWKRALQAFKIKKSPIHSVLVLGLGGGTVLEMFSSMYPGIAITCVEIDNTIIDIAKKYFHIDQLPNLEIVHDDAKQYVAKRVKGKKRYDCIVVDLSFGRNIPPFVQSPQFIEKLRFLLSNDGVLLMNFLREKEYKEKAETLEKTLHSLFPYVKDYQIANNRFFASRLK